jgi:hypothetical protein
MANWQNILRLIFVGVEVQKKTQGSSVVHLTRGKKAAGLLNNTK